MYIKKLKHPIHYKLDENYYDRIKTQTLNEVTVKNEELGYLQILKMIIKDYPTITANLAEPNSIFIQIKMLQMIAL
ncbi:MAG: hypothetical protein ACLRQF_02540 [Thomasclavelia ramosa]